jgi:hypothetical protein
VAIIDDVRVVKADNDPETGLKVGDHCLALIYENESGETLAHYAALIIKDEEKMETINLSDALCSPSVLREQRPFIESYLVIVEGRVHLKEILLCTIMALDEEDFSKNLGEHFIEIALFDHDQWQMQLLSPEDIRFDILEYSRMSQSGTSWEVSKIFPDGYFSLTETTGGAGSYVFKVSPVFAKGFTPTPGAELVISPKGEFFWGVNREMAKSIAKAPLSGNLKETDHPLIQGIRSCLNASLTGLKVRLAKGWIRSPKVSPPT